MGNTSESLSSAPPIVTAFSPTIHPSLTSLLPQAAMLAGFEGAYFHRRKHDHEE
jgi:hypothetical protein